jgi:hypothetical protein
MLSAKRNIVDDDVSMLTDVEETMARFAHASRIFYFVQSAAPAGNAPVTSLIDNCNNAQDRLKL